MYVCVCVCVCYYIMSKSDKKSKVEANYFNLDKWRQISEGKIE